METMKMKAAVRTLVQPVYSTPHPLAGEKVPLTVFDRAAFDIFVPTVLAYPAPAPSNEALKDGLRRAVALYPHLAGRLAVDDRGRRFLHVNDEGVLVVEAAISVDLADVLAGGMTDVDVVGDELYPSLPEDNVGAPLLQMKLSRCRCGGLVVGIICHHHVADGHSMSTFFTTWATAVRAGAGKEDFNVPAPPPFLDRAATAVSRATPAPVFDHRSIEFKGGDAAADGGRRSSEPYAVVPMEEDDKRIRNVTVHFTHEFIGELKARVGGVRCSTFQCLLAHVWKKITAARDLQLEEFTQVRVAVNCRSRACPAVPTDFFGNMVLWAFPRLQVKDLLSSSYCTVVDAIRDAVARVDGEYIQSFVDFGAVADAGGEELVATAAAAGTMLSPDLEVDSWLGFQFHQMDLGTGPPCAFLPPDLPIEGLMIFVPSRGAKGGVDLFMAVAECHVEAFQQICHSVDNGAAQNGDAILPQAGSAGMLDADEFRRQGHQVIDFIADYYGRMDDYPVHPSVSPGFLRHRLPATAPSRPEFDAFGAALRDVRDLILPGMTHWQSARHFAHFPASSSTVGALGEALTAGINVVPFTWAASPAATELEMVVVDWLGKALHLPESLMFCGGGGGTLLGTTCEAILCALVAARDRKLADIGGGRIGDLVVYCSDQTHFAFRKAAHIAGIHRDNCRAIATYRDDMFALSPAELRAAMQADVDAGLVPLFLCATVGTTQTTAVDPIRELCAVAAAHGVWVHVDAAYAGSALVCPEFRHLIDGADAVDSFSMNAHKWLLANNDCCALWVKKPSLLVAALGTEQEYILKDAAAEGHDVVDYKDWSVTLTRRFRALKLWLVLRCYGVEGLRQHIRGHVDMAAAFEDMVKADPRFEVTATRRFALVCFRLRATEKVGGPKAANELNRRLLEEVNAACSGPYLSSANVGGMYMLRCAVGSTLTEERHVRQAWKVVQDRAASLLRKMEIRNTVA